MLMFTYVYLQELSSSQKSGGNLLQMLYDKPSRWSYTFQVITPDSAFPSEALSRFNYSSTLTCLTCHPLYLSMSPVRATLVSAESVLSFSLLLSSFNRLKTLFSSTSALSTQTGKCTHLRPHTWGTGGLFAKMYITAVSVCTDTCLHPTCLSVGTCQKRSGTCTRTGTPGY